MNIRFKILRVIFILFAPIDEDVFNKLLRKDFFYTNVKLYLISFRLRI